ncbi:MAG: class I SAM-dependent methyltransferase [Cyanobacteria bacterium P01_H01_bin.121]
MYQLYSQYLLPHLLDRVMSRPPFPDYRAALLQDVEGDVLEIGFGSGLNLPHYSGEVKALTVVDPNRGMQRLAQTRLAQTQFPVQHQAISGEALPFVANRFDYVVSTWTLCSIPKVEQAIAEVYRVLRPGGKFVFIEHGLADEPKLQRWQHRLTPLQRLIGDGCHLDRPIEAIVRTQFQQLQLQTFYAEGLPRIGSYSYQGIATKPA